MTSAEISAKVQHMKIVYKALLKRDGKLLSANPHLKNAALEYSTSKTNRPKGKSYIYTFKRLVDAKTFLLQGRAAVWKMNGLIKNGDYFELWRCSASGIKEKPDLIPVSCEGDGDNDFGDIISAFVNKGVLLHAYLTFGMDGTFGVKKLKLLKKLKIIKI